MIQALVVDDEIHCAEGVKCAIDWKALGVTQVYTAYSMAQAQKVFQEEEIHILISDVEMPKGSGFQLLGWVRDRGYKPVVIMLTSYATFAYAKQAIEYQCMEYLLKPIKREDLAEAAARAVAEVMDRRKKDDNYRLAEYWNANERKHVQHFWREIIEHNTHADSETIMAYARQSHVTLDERNQYLPILYRIYAAGEHVTWSSVSEELKSLFYRHVFHDEEQVALVYNHRYLLAIAGYADDLLARREQLFRDSRRFQEEIPSHCGIHISVYLGEFRESSQVAAQYVRLVEMDENNVTERPGVYSAMEQSGTAAYQRPDIEAWMKDFSAGKYGKTIEEVERCVDLMSHERRLDQGSLAQLLQDFMQAFYIILGKKELQAHQLFGDEASLKLYRQAGKSVKDFKVWINHIVKKSAEYVTAVSDAGAVVHRVKKYIRENLGAELSRNQIAGHVCMSPDYVSRVFHLETGTLLSDYIVQMRMAEAEHLLESTCLPIGEVACQVGYYNLAYFSHVFRIRKGMTPAAYRKSLKQNSE